MTHRRHELVCMLAWCKCPLEHANGARGEIAKHVMFPLNVVIFSKGVTRFLLGFHSISSTWLVLSWLVVLARLWRRSSPPFRPFAWFVVGARLWGWFSPPFRQPVWFVVGTRLWGRSSPPFRPSAWFVVGPRLWWWSSPPFQAPKLRFAIDYGRTFAGWTFTPSSRDPHAVSALSTASFSKLRLSLPTIPSIFNALNAEFPGYLRHPIFIGKHHVFQPFALHCSTRSSCCLKTNDGPWANNWLALARKKHHCTGTYGTA